MIIHSFGDTENKTVILIHGVLTPWRIWQPMIDCFCKEYCVIVPELDGHMENRPSDFQPVQKEAEAIEEFILAQRNGEAYAVMGLSMGGAIAHEIMINGRIRSEYYIMDGAPLIPFPKLLSEIMTKNYADIIKRSKARDERVMASFKRDFLPEKYLDDYLKIADNMNEGSVKNMLSSFGRSGVKESSEDRGKILFIHGTKGNEVLSAKSARLIKKKYPASEIICFKGDKHCEKAIFSPEEWCGAVKDFLRNSSKP